MYGRLVIPANKITGDVEITVSGNKVIFYNIWLRKRYGNGDYYYMVNGGEPIKLPVNTDVKLQRVTSLDIKLSVPTSSKTCVYEIRKSDGTLIKSEVVNAGVIERSITQYLEDHCCFYVYDY